MKKQLDETSKGTIEESFYKCRYDTFCEALHIVQKLTSLD